MIARDEYFAAGAAEMAYGDALVAISSHIASHGDWQSDRVLGRLRADAYKKGLEAQRLHALYLQAHTGALARM